MTITVRARKLTADRVVDVAYELISKRGLDWFSMRKLAVALDVNPMTVYLRFENKDELLDAVARRGLAQVTLPDLPNASWAERAVALSEALRAHLIADRNLLGLYSTAGRLSSAILHSVEQGLTLMEEVGYRDDHAVLAFRSLFWHSVGLVLVDHSFEKFPANTPGGLQQTLGPVDMHTLPTFARHLPSFASLDGDALFSHTTHLLVAGLEAGAPTTTETP